jgi:hypothetical protein
MLFEIKLKYYNSTLKIGFNNLREAVYDVSTDTWLSARVHQGRLVYGDKRIPFAKIRSGIDKRNYVVQQYCPF